MYTSPGFTELNYNFHSNYFYDYGTLFNQKSEFIDINKSAIRQYVNILRNHKSLPEAMMPRPPVVPLLYKLLI